MNNKAWEERISRLNALADDFLEEHKWDSEIISRVNAAVAKIAIPFDQKQLTDDLYLIVARGKGNRKYQLMLRDPKNELPVEAATLPEKAMIMAALPSFIESYIDYVKEKASSLLQIAKAHDNKT